MNILSHSSTHDLGDSKFSPKTHVRNVAKGDVWWLLLVLAIGAILRFYHPEVIDWSSDHSDIALLAQNLVYGEGVPLLGHPSSAVVPHSPLFVYPSIIPFSVTDDPILAGVFSAFLNLIGLGIIWFIGFRYFGRLVAFTAAITYTVNPWVLGYSRSIWAGDHRAMFVSLGILLGLLGFVEGKRWAQILCFPILLIGIQTHYAAYTLLPLFLLFLWIGRDRIAPKFVLASIVLSLLVILPYALGIVTMFTSDGAIISTIRPQPRDVSLREIVKPYGYMFWLATGTGTELYSARENAEELRSLALIPTSFWYINGFAVFLGIVSLWMYHSRKIASVLSLWAFLTLFVFTAPIIGVYPHYFIPVIPAVSLLTGIGIVYLFNLLSRVSMLLGIGVLVVFGAVFLTQAAFWFASIRYLDTHYTPSQFGFGTPVHYLMQVRDELKQYRNIIFVTSNDWLDFSRTGSRVFSPFLRDTAHCLRDVKIGSNIAVIPDEPFAAVYAPRLASESIYDGLYHSKNQRTFPLRLHEGEYTVYSFLDLPTWEASPITSIEPVVFMNGIQLTGYHAESNRLTLRWVLPEPTKVNYNYRLRLFDSNDRLLIERDMEFWPSQYWCEGDQLFSWVDIDQLGEAFTLQVSMLNRFGASPYATDATPDAVTQKLQEQRAIIHLRSQ
jgi:hypothetical protein